MNRSSDFWNVLAQFHAEIEDTNFDLASVRCLLPEVESPVLVVGAGHGLIVAELRKAGHQCDGVDLSSEMIRQAKLRRGITLFEADAKAMPFPAASYSTIIYATGVVDFSADEDEIGVMLKEGRRVAKEGGKLFVAFYRARPVQENFLKMVGLLSDTKLAFRESLEIHLLNPAQMVNWVAARASLGRFRAMLALLRMGVLSTAQERKHAFKMHRVMRKFADPRTLINAAPETLPYRNQSEIEKLFKRLDFAVEQISAFASCCVARL
jgi:ubiquinone/menaquinone biosynthesis C-methylase UbiE